VFDYCTSLTSVTIGTNVTSIGADAFFCTSLTRVTIPSSVTNIGAYAFQYCTSLTNISVAANNPAYTSVSGVLFDKQKTTLIVFPAELAGSYVIPNSVISIGTYAFCDCYSLKQVTIPNSVTSIGDYAFCACYSLTNVTIGNSVTSIGDGAFYFCDSLTSVTSPDSVTSIGTYAFWYCTSLKQVAIPNSVTSIGDDAFGNCTSLTASYFQGNAPPDDGTAFTKDSNATVYYLPGTTGWGATFGSSPTALWFLPNPLILNTGSNFGMQSNRFGFTISWDTNISVVVQACTNLANPVWQPVATNALSNGFSYFSDSKWTNYHSRFYRLRSP
jgi:hypothetical protein